MNEMFHEIMEIPEKAFDFAANSQSFVLPENVPYLGMGSSYFAPLAFKMMGKNIFPEIASEYFNYQVKGKYHDAVILSQSGYSSEALWCSTLFEKYIAITNSVDSPLSKAHNVSEVVSILAGHESFSSSKTYINTLLALFKGFGMNMEQALNLLKRKFSSYAEKGQMMANEVHSLIAQSNIHGIYIIGSGPNIATAFEASLILSESTKMCFNGMPMAQYDHGPKETAANSIVINIVAKGKSYERSQKLNVMLLNAGAHVFTVEEPEIDEHFSIIHNMIPFNFLAYHLAQKLNISDTFVIGGKVTEVD